MGLGSLMLAIAISGLFVLPVLSVSTSRLDLSNPERVSKGFRVELKHVDAGKNLTKFEKLQNAVKRGHHRLQKLNSMAITTGQIETPIHVGNGEFLMTLSIGTPAQSYQAIMDTGSDLIWTQCMPCQECFDQPTPIFDPKKSSTFSKLPCSSQLCKALHRSTCNGECEYAYSYGDYSSTQGVLASESFTFGDEKVSKIGFGCGEENQGSGFSQGSGLVGLGRGPLSLVSQLDESKFSYCLVSIDSSKEYSSTLLMGSLANVNDTKDESMVITPLLKNPSQPSFYYLGLQGITVGATRLPIKESTFELKEDGTGGMIIDSGTTITYLEQSAFDALKTEFISQTQLNVDNSGSIGLDLCFKLPAGAEQVQVPKLKLHFEGGDLDLPAENYMIGDSGLGVVCLAMGRSSGMSILGNVQQQNIMVLHDLEKQTVSFIPTQCDKM